MNLLIWQYCTDAISRTRGNPGGRGDVRGMRLKWRGVVGSLDMVEPVHTFLFWCAEGSCLISTLAVSSGTFSFALKPGCVAVSALKLVFSSVYPVPMVWLVGVARGRASHGSTHWLFDSSWSPDPGRALVLAAAARACMWAWSPRRTGAGAAHQTTLPISTPAVPELHCAEHTQHSKPLTTLCMLMCSDFPKHTSKTVAGFRGAKLLGESLPAWTKSFLKRSGTWLSSRDPLQKKGGVGRMAGGSPFEMHITC